MPSPRWRKVARDLRVHASRTVLVVLAISIGLIGAGSVLDTWSLMRQVTRGEFLASNPPSATLRVDSIDDALLTRVRALPAVRAAEARRTVIGTARTQNGWRTAMLFSLENFGDARIGAIKRQSGQWPPDDATLTIESSSVEFAGLGLGDSIEVRLGDGPPRVLAVTGITRDVGLAPGWMENVVYGFVTPATLAELGAPPTFNELLIAVRDTTLSRTEIRRVAGEVRAVAEKAGHRVTSVDVPVPGRHIHAGQIDSLIFTQGAFGLLALVLSSLLVINLVSAMLAGQVREIGVMKAVGAGQGQIAMMYLVIALLLGMVATVIAVPTAAIIGRAYADFTAGMLNFSTEGFEIPIRVILWQAAVGLVLPVAAAAIPVIRGCGISVGAALRDFGIVERGSHQPGFLSRITGVGRPLLLSLRNAFRRRQRMALTLITLAAGGAVYLGALNLRAAIRGSVNLLFETQRFDIVLRFARSWPADSLERAIATVPGVAMTEAWSGARASVSHPDGLSGNPFPVSAPPNDSRMLIARPDSGRWLRPGDENALVVNRRLLEDEPSLTLGSRTVLVIAGRPTNWTVIGLVETGPSPAAYAPREALAKVVSDGRVDRAVVRAELRGAPSQLDLVQRLRTELARGGFEVQSSQLMTDSRKIVEDHLLMVASFLGIMGQLMILVGGLGLASTMSLGVLERTREIGVLRAIGARHGSIMTMIQVEGLVIALVSWLIAIPLSVPMSVFLGEAFGRVMIRVPVILVPDVTGVLRWLAVVVAVSAIACLWPALRAMRVPTAAALAYE